MIIVRGVRELRAEHGRLFVVLGVFDGLHRGHLYLLDALGHAAEARGAMAAVVTFDHHPDEILTGSAPPLLVDPEERIRLLGEAGVGLTVVHHFDLQTRQTPYDAFIRAIAERVDLAGFLMTPDSSFGYQRGGTPETVTRLGRELGYDLVVVPTLERDGRAIRSADIRAAIARGDLSTAESLLGRPYGLVGDLQADGTLAFAMPVALPPPGRHPGLIGGRPVEIAIGADGRVSLDGVVPPRSPVRVTFG